MGRNGGTLRWGEAMKVSPILAAIGALTLLGGPAPGQTCPAPGTVEAACGGDCARITVGSASGSSSTAGMVSISFEQGPDDGQAQRGNDDVAAIAFTLGIPGTGDGAPLVLPCNAGNLADGAVVAGAAISGDFTVVVENAQCTNRNRCLCPDTGAGQTRDNFVNVAIYGPKNLPEQGPVAIPKLPASGEIVKLNLRAAPGTPEGEIPLHVFSALDASKPQFAANLSIGDQSACDVTANGTQSAVLFTDGRFTVVPPTGGGCMCDCDGNGTVQINELISCVNIALTVAPVESCAAADPDGNGQVSISDLIAAVNNALNGCPQ